RSLASRARMPKDLSSGRICRQIHVAAANEYPNALARRRTVGTGDKRGERGCAARLGGDLRLAPKPALGFDDRRIVDQYGVCDRIDALGVDDVTNALGAEAVGGDARHWNIHRAAALHGAVEGAGAFGFHGHDLDLALAPALVPAGDAGDQPTAADSDEHRVEIRSLCLPF